MAYHDFVEGIWSSRSTKDLFLGESPPMKFPSYVALVSTIIDVEPSIID